jgi:hypothetical protein
VSVVWSRSMGYLPRVPGTLRAIIYYGLLLLLKLSNFSVRVSKQVLCGHWVTFSSWRSHPDKIKIQLISNVLLFDNTLLLNIDVFANHQWRLILSCSLLWIACGSSSLSNACTRSVWIVSLKTPHRFAMRWWSWLLRGVLLRIMAISTIRLVNMVPRTDHHPTWSSDTSWLRILSLEQSCSSSLI